MPKRKSLKKLKKSWRRKYGTIKLELLTEIGEEQEQSDIRTSRALYQLWERQYTWE